MTKRTIMGGKPETDPLAELGAKFSKSVPMDHVFWMNRARRIPMWRIFLLSLTVFILGFYQPVVMLTGAIIILVIIWLLPGQRPAREEAAIASNAWTHVEFPEVTLAVENDVLLCKSHHGTHYVTGMVLPEASGRLAGDLSALLRSLPMDHGFTLVVELDPEPTDCVRESGVVEDLQEVFFDEMPDAQIDSFFLSRGFIWSTRTAIVGHVASPGDVPIFQSSVVGALPETHWTPIKSRSLAQSINEFDVSGSRGFYATGKELSEWLVQLAGELASEIGGNVPGEFLSPLRPPSSTYPIGRVINPETLQIGSPAGLDHNDFLNGLLIGGGTNDDRRHVLTLVVQRLLAQGKRVVYIATDPTARNIAALAPDGICLTLGRDFVLNPMDPEGIPQKSYVSQLMKALEVVLSTKLRGAVELELALMRAISSGSATLADVRLDDVIDDDPDSGLATAPSRSSPSMNQSEYGLAGIQRLYKGEGANAFYGTQSAPTDLIAQHGLTVILAGIDRAEIEKFALDLLAIKFAGLRPDPDLVIIFENAPNFKTRTMPERSQEPWRVSWVEVMIKQLLHRGGLVFATDDFNGLPKVIVSQFSAAMMFRLQNTSDISIASDLLGLSVIQHGLYSSSRRSPQESSYLRTMPQGTVLFRPIAATTCFPVKLDSAPELVPLDMDAVESRLAALVSPKEPESEERRDSLLFRVAGRDHALALEVLRLLERYEPLTTGAIQRFLRSTQGEDVDIEGVLSRLERASMVLRGHEVHGNVSYINFRLTMKGAMALKQAEQEAKDT
ncbi:MAG: hypothetical protein K9W43_04565 [Candidatus Thorarchaeota archaeon]|nr:hypothetical protein [Candidatus Thorarchaeota archaeon]